MKPPFEVAWLTLLAACLGFSLGELRKGAYHYVYAPPLESFSSHQLTTSPPSSPAYSDQWVAPSEAKRRLRLTLFLTQLANPSAVNQIPSSGSASSLALQGSRAVVLTPTSPVQYNTQHIDQHSVAHHPNNSLGRRRRKPKFGRRQKEKPQARGSPQSRDGSCRGHCSNMFACMLQGGKPETKGAQNCPGLFHVCCSRWSSLSGTSASHPQPPISESPKRARVQPAFNTYPTLVIPATNGYHFPRQEAGSQRVPKHLRLRPQKSGRALSMTEEDPEENVISYSSASAASAANSLPAESISYNHHHGVPIPLTSYALSIAPNLLQEHLPQPSQALVNRFAPSEIEQPYMQCGVSRNANRRIMGGLDAGYGQFPWTAHIKIRGPSIDKECGGTLINQRWILTAGHCTQYCINVPLCGIEIPQHEITYKVILGEYDQLENEPVLPDAYMAIDVIRHPLYRNVMRLRENGYLESEPRYDLALLLLDREVKLAPNVAPICLPTPEFLDLDPGTPSTVVGWGRVGRDSKAPHSNILQAATIPILSDSQCLSETGLSNFDDQICAGNSDSDISACPGDSGGALQVQDDEGRWMIVGIVSNGPSVCGLQPVIFHKIAKTLSWITNVMERQAAPHIP
eukprot:snap_masked-scaffold424_size175595-processed-gene-0.2 protein:Tk01541 transcript:snap_masked-scaffold424_size175595-processed-gene-0.2-mRNA-1 annotation:"hypothetical protein DAPPUDRAFT_305317"